jgi:hypothetical protein
MSEESPFKKSFVNTSVESISEIITASLQAVPAKERTILDSTGRNFPLVGRDKESDQLLDNFDKRYADSLTQKKDKENNTVAFLFGVPGLGKSRMNVEYITLLQSAIQRRLVRVLECEAHAESETEEYIKHPSSECQEYIKLVENAITTHITYNTSYLASKTERQLLKSEERAPESLWLRVLYFYCGIGESIAEFISRFQQISVTSEHVIRFILESKGIKLVKQDPLQPILQMLYLGIDEYNMIIDLVDEIGQSKLDQIVCDVQLAMKYWAEYGIMITSFFTGTRKKDISALYAGFFGLCTPILSSPLSFEESCKVVSDVAWKGIPIKLIGSQVEKTLVKTEVLSNERMQAISLLGGLPRCIEVYTQILALSRGKEMSELVREVFTEITRRYNLVVDSPDIFYDILSKYIRQELVSADLKLGDRTIDQYQADGLLLLEKVGDQYKIILPFPWLYHISHELRTNDKYPAAHALYAALQQVLSGDWEHFEMFGAYYWQALALFYYNEKGGITYRQLARGAVFLPDTKQLDAIIPLDYEAIKKTVLDGNQIKLAHQYPDNHGFKLFEKEIFANGAGASIDVFAKGTGVLVGAEMKHSGKLKAKEIDLKEFNEKLGNSLKSVKNWNTYLAKLKSKDRDTEKMSLKMYCYISNRPWSTNDAYPKVLNSAFIALLTRDRMVSFYGSAIADVLKYSNTLQRLTIL